jgi:hypothetical protein
MVISLELVVDRVRAACHTIVEVLVPLEAVEVRQ